MPDEDAELTAPDGITAALTFLPPAFALIPRLLMHLDDPGADDDALANVIGVDPELTADVLRVANSSAYGRSAKVETLSGAVSRIGLRGLHRTIVNIVALPVLTNAQQPGFARLDLRRHSLAAAVAAELLATHLRIVETDLAFTAALLHDIGKVVLAQAVGNGYLGLAENVKATNGSVFKMERATFHTDHAMVGAKLLKEWNFPDRLVQAIAYHHRPDAAPNSYSRLAALIFAANVVAYRIGSGYGFPPYAGDPDASWLKLAELTPAVLFSYEDDVRQALQWEHQRFGNKIDFRH